MAQAVDASACHVGLRLILKPSRVPPAGAQATQA
jgi:hypothetical protein